MKTKNNFSYINISIFISCYALLALCAIEPEASWDIYWHLKMGKDLIDNGLSPYIDHYSFTNYGDSITAVPVLFQLMVASLVKILNEDAGFYAFKLIYISVLFVLIFLYFNKIKATPWVVVIILPIMSYFVDHRLMLRPELIGNILIIACMILYYRAKHTFNHKELLFISLLLLFWVNYHSPVMGYIIIFSLFLDRFIYKLKNKNTDFSWGFFYSWAAIVFLIGFLNKQAEHFIFPMLSFMASEEVLLTMEYLPTSEFYSTNIMVHLSWMLSFCVGVWSFTKKEYGYAFLSILLLYFSWSTVRLVTPAALVNLSIFALLLSDFIEKKEYLSLKPVIQKTLVIAGIGLASFNFYELSSNAYVEYKYRYLHDYRMETRLPIKVTSYLKAHHTGGHILNPLSDGGYLLNNLAPNFKVYLDGRTNILYPITRIKDYMAIINDKKLLKKEIEKYNIDYVLLENKPQFVSTLWGLDEMELNYADNRFVLYSNDRNKVSFPITSLMLSYPACWKEKMEKDIANENVLANKVNMDNNRLLKTVVVLLSNYGDSSDKKTFIRSQLTLNNLHDRVKRILGYLAVENKMYKEASEFFKNIVSNNNNDLFMQIESSIHSGEYEMAEEMLLSYASVNVFYFMENIEIVDKSKVITAEYTSHILRQLELIEKFNGLKLFKGEDFDLLKSSHNYVSYIDNAKDDTGTALLICNSMINK